MVKGGHGSGRGRGNYGWDVMYEKRIKEKKRKKGKSKINQNKKQKIPPLPRKVTKGTGKSKTVVTFNSRTSTLRQFKIKLLRQR